MAGTGIPGTDAYDDNAAEVNTLYPDLDRYSLFAYADYDVTDELTVFAQYLHGHNAHLPVQRSARRLRRAADRA